MKKFYGNGKLLLTGEYVVLDGAEALALPTKLGQSLSVEEFGVNQVLSWKAFLADHSSWFYAEFQLPDFELLHTDDVPKAQMLQKVLSAVRLLRPEFLMEERSFEVQTKLDFPESWGLGSSSTFIHNMAIWAEVNPYELLQLTFGGSGYDLACAASNKALLYSLDSIKTPRIEEVHFRPSFSNQLFFVHLNRKQNSREAIKHYRGLNTAQKHIQAFSQLSRRLLEAQEDVQQFSSMIIEHEELMASVLNQKSVVKALFTDYPFAMKSLGAWGGDFVLAIGEEAQEYFPNKGYTTVLGFEELFKE